MKKIALIILCCCGLMIAMGSIRYIHSEPSCTGPYKQPNGCNHYVCVGDDGRRFCKECCPNQPCTIIKCE